MAMNFEREANKRDPATNPDPITGAPGAHPVGTGLGAAGGGAAGAAIGSLVGPIGTVAGAVIGAVAGGLGGKAAAESIDPTIQDAYWENNYRTRPYASSTGDYNEIRPAYRYGWESAARSEGKPFNDVEPMLERDWDGARNECPLPWESAKPAVRDAYDRASPGRRAS